MKIKEKISIGIVGLLACLPLQAAIIGQDDMVPFAEASRFSLANQAAATATQVKAGWLKDLGNGHSSYPAKRLYGFCPGERFAGLQTMGSCSGFLIGPDLFVTAGHCLDKGPASCGDDAWVFGYYRNEEGQAGAHIISQDRIFRCKEVLDFRHDKSADYAVIRLDRPVHGVRPFELDLSSESRLPGDPLAVLGYPLGLPLTYTPGGKVLGEADGILHTDLDAHKNNSGSVILNLRTGYAIGILTNGVAGLTLNTLDGCMETKYHPAGITYANLLSRIPFLQGKFPERSKITEFRLENRCQEKIEVVAKYRSPKDNVLLTKHVQLGAGQAYTVQGLHGLIYLFARDGAGKTLVSGKDFYGFADASRSEEFGFLRVESGNFSFCGPGSN